MLFNSFEFILLFVPVTVAVFYLLGSRLGEEKALFWLVLASLYFYGYWNFSFVALIVFSILFNYTCGYFLASEKLPSALARKNLLIVGIVVNLLLLGYFKYYNFFIDNINTALGLGLDNESILLPLAISFFTFQQIAYLADSYQNQAHEYNFTHYCLFVTFFPQLVAGPIVHHKEMMPQFEKRETFRFDPQNLSVGLTIFIIGLFKKVVIADSLAQYANPVFHAAEAGVALTTIEAWGGALAYTFQLYFDFSGYSDMAIGLARMFGIKLPLNFHSPYKADSIVEFWRRWHITLSRFLRDYLYIPLGGNRKGPLRRYGNLLITMLLGGLWHGAGWTFIVWGGLHGVYLIINHAWLAMKRKLLPQRKKSSPAGRIVGILITFTAVTLAWVFFRAESMGGAFNLLTAMFGGNGTYLPLEAKDLFGASPELFRQLNYFNAEEQLQLLLVALAIVWLLPNTQQFMSRYEPAFHYHHVEKLRLLWRPTAWWSAVFSLVTIVTLYTIMKTGYEEFIYRFF